MTIDTLQRYLHEKVARLDFPDTLILWESEQTYTAGRRTQPEDIPNDDVPVITMDRGGSVTYHGPGQLVIYPIVKVRPPQDVVAFVRNTEKALIAAVSELGITAKVVPGRSGVWIDAEYLPTHLESKLCAIGIKFANTTTMHGMAFNVTTDLDQFMRVVPCGIADAGVTSLAQLGHSRSMSEVGDLLVQHLVPTYQRFLLRPDSTVSTHENPLALIAEASAHHRALATQTGVAWKRETAEKNENKL